MTRKKEAERKFYQRPETEKKYRLEVVRDWLSNNNFCALPYVHMAIEANGAIRPCCMGKPLDLNITGKKIHEAFDDPVRQEFVDAFDKGEQHPNCAICWKDKAMGKFNNRVKFSTQDEVFEFTESVMNGATPERNLKWLEVKPGNRCNLKCRICGVHNSSMWTKDYYHTVEYLKKEEENFTPSTFKDSEQFHYTEQCKWIDDVEFWEEVQGLDSLNLIHFMGGEPFMVPEHFQLLEALINNPNIDTSKTIIRYNTNGTYFPNEEQIKIWEKFYRVMFLISVDDIGARFEYQRKLANWEEVKENLIKFNNLQYYDRELDVWRIKCFIDPTVSMFNIWNLGEIYDGFAELGYELNEANNHFVTGGWNDCRYLPESIKQVITERHADNEHIWVQQAIRYMNSKPIDHPLHNITMFYKIMMYQDHLRNERFDDLWPEYYHLMTEHIDWSKISQEGTYKETKYEQKNI